MSTSAESWQERLRASGHRLTPQRELVLAAVETLGHATPDEVYAEVRTHSESINLSTIYRTLELLNELGLIRHAHLSDRAPTYHSATRPRARPLRLPQLQEDDLASGARRWSRRWARWLRSTGSAPTTGTSRCSAPAPTVARSDQLAFWTALSSRLSIRSGALCPLSPSTVTWTRRCSPTRA